MAALCPHCGGDEHLAEHSADGVAVRCLRCGARGPVAPEADAAWAAWRHRHLASIDARLETAAALNRAIQRGVPVSVGQPTAGSSGWEWHAVYEARERQGLIEYKKSSYDTWARLPFAYTLVGVKPPPWPSSHEDTMSDEQLASLPEAIRQAYETALRKPKITSYRHQLHDDLDDALDQEGWGGDYNLPRS